MSDQVGRQASSSPAVDRSASEFVIRRTMFGRLKSLLRLAWLILFSPIRLILAIRRAMTPASVTLLLVGIVSTNIIWGYPWIGVFSACVSLFVVGFLLNRWSLPSLEADFLLPRSAVAGSPFPTKALLTNQGWFPAMELQIALNPNNGHSKASVFQTKLESGIVEMIRPGERFGMNATLQCSSRGIHQLPDICVTSWFPFHLFRFTRSVQTIATIPITPKLLTEDDESLSSGLLDSLGTWTRKVLSGDAMDYTGSREYEAGMPVRRWDFASWARLGQPIIREYQSPSVRTLTFVVDTANDRDAVNDPKSADQVLERVLSLAATAIEHVGRQPIQVRLYVTGQDWSLQSEAGTDRESMLIRLAAANRESDQLASQAIAGLCQHLGNSPLLLMTSRSNPLGQQAVPASVTILSVDTIAATEQQQELVADAMEVMGSSS